MAIMKIPIMPMSHWLPFGDTGSEYRDRWQCERCRKTCRTETWGKRCEYEFCPHCGAIMKGEENERTGND